MKRIVLVYAAVLLLGGLASSVQAQSLIGTWSGTLSFVAEGGGRSEFASGTASLHVTNQVAGLFMGYFVSPGSSGDTNSVAGIVQASLLAPGSFDVSLTISAIDSHGGTATGLLTTNGLPKIWRIVYSRPGQDTGTMTTESVAAGGKMLKTSSTPW